MHLCLHQALGYAMKWHDLPTNPAADAEPPAVPAHTLATLTPEQVGILLAVAHHDRRPWLCAFTTLAAGQQRGSAMGAHYRHTTPEMAARITTAIQQRLRLVLEIAEQALESHPSRSTRRVF